MFLPTWMVYYRKRRPTLGRPLTSRDYDAVEVGAMSQEDAAAAFRQRFPPSHEIMAICAESGTGMA
jgi:hypothetical protein